MAHLLDSAKAGFLTTYGEPAEGVWSAPGRANLIGEHTDYNGGFALPLAIDRRTWVAVRCNGTDRFRVASAMYTGVVEALLSEVGGDQIPKWATYVLGMAAVLDAGYPSSEPRGVDIFVVSDVPLGAGLSSSAALECSVGVALNDLWNLGLSRTDLALAGQRAENTVVGAPTGVMDQSASLKGKADSAILLDCRSNETEVVPLGLRADHLVLLIVDTREEHSHADNEYAERRASCEKAAALLGVAQLRDVDEELLKDGRHLLDDETYRRVRHVVSEDARVLETVRVLRDSGPLNIGSLLTQSHISLRDDFEVTTQRLNLVVDVALAHGAISARMTGGGFGGSAIALVPENCVDEVINAIGLAFVAAGYGEPGFFRAVASDGARKESD